MADIDNGGPALIGILTAVAMTAGLLTYIETRPDATVVIADACASAVPENARLECVTIGERFAASGGDRTVFGGPQDVFAEKAAACVTAVNDRDRIACIQVALEAPTSRG